MIYKQDVADKLSKTSNIIYEKMEEKCKKDYKEKGEITGSIWKPCFII